MTFSLIIFLYVYYAFLVAWSLVCLVALYHMLKFGMRNFTTFFVTFIFIGIAVLMLYSSFYFINQIDWSLRVSVFEGVFNNEFPF